MNDRDRLTFDRLLRKAEPHLYAFAINTTKKTDAAKELCAESSRRALKSWAQYDPNRSFKTWIISIAKNAYFDHRKSERRRKTDSLDEMLSSRYGAYHEGMEKIVESGPEVITLYRETVSAAVALWRALPLHQQQAVALVIIEGLSYTDASVQAGVKINTLKTRLHRAKILLRRKQENP